MLLHAVPEETAGDDHDGHDAPRPPREEAADASIVATLVDASDHSGGSVSQYEGGLGKAGSDGSREEDRLAFVGILRECDFARFAPSSTDAEGMRDLLSRARELIRSLEQGR